MESSFPTSVPYESARPTPPWYHWRRLGFNFLTLSLLAHLFLGVGAAYLVVQTISQRKQTFAGGPTGPTAATHALEHQVQMQKKQATMSAPAAVKRITTVSNAKVSLPAMPPVFNAEAQVLPLSMAGMGGAGLGPGFGAGGSGGGNGKGTGMTIFGARGGQGLVGTFYDLKQNTGGGATNMALQPNEQGRGFDINAPVNKIYDRTLASLVGGGMNLGVLANYFRAPQTLTLTQLYIPAISAEEAPQAFNVGDRVKGRRWIVLYRGKVTAPVSGRYKFAGFGDDILVVRLNGQVVLDASYAPPTKGGSAGQPKEYGKTITGQSVEVSAGSAIPMEILIGERPGGEFAAYLLVEKDGEQYGKQPNGDPLLPIFKMARGGAAPNPGRVAPPVAPDTSWSIWRGESTAPTPNGI